MQIKPAVRGSDKAACSSISPRTRAQRSALPGEPRGPALAQPYPAAARPRQAAQEPRAGRRRAGTAPAARAEARGGHPAPSRGRQGPAGRSPWRSHPGAPRCSWAGPASAGGSGWSCRRWWPCGESAAVGRRHVGPRPPPTPTAAPGGAGMRNPRPSRTPSRSPRPAPALTRRCRWWCSWRVPRPPGPTPTACFWGAGGTRCLRYGPSTCLSREPGRGEEGAGERGEGGEGRSQTSTAGQRHGRSEQQQGRSAPRRALRKGGAVPARARLPLAPRRAHWAAASAAQPIGSGVTRAASGDWLGRAHSRPPVLQRGRWGALQGLRAKVGAWRPLAALAGPGAPVPGRRSCGSAGRSGPRGTRLGPAPDTGPVPREERRCRRDRPWFSPWGHAGLLRERRGGEAAGCAPWRCPRASAAAPEHRPAQGHGASPAGRDGTSGALGERDQNSARSDSPLQPSLNEGTSLLFLPPSYAFPWVFAPRLCLRNFTLLRLFSSVKEGNLWS